ncbi:MAG: acyl-CoA thioesterase [Sinimarinibacterium flocculans]|uniref:Acyl-CoA thioester hydrolase n=1 Tax=Sinimarinibacterium flocculans TaxID=985250 RepID=A0A318E984_9GAMM|nr:thioesterase family protein [Sinimarinibacterium flocculans]MEC9362689.1 thioesterase family protein [Pseudomonadota bacterium]PXV68475.1 acyl-CoA thioester hydrolase [Sinimarinibacterium flocculans]
MTPDDAARAFDWDVERPHLDAVTVGAEHLDRFGHTNNVVYLAWLERVAWSHSVSLGLDFEAYERIGAGCVARRHELDYLAPTFGGDRLWLATWVHENDFRLSMWRRYQIVREGDGKTVLRGATQWVCVDMASGRPRRMPAEFRAYEPWPEKRR